MRKNGRDFGLRNQKCQNRLHSNTLIPVNSNYENFVMVKFMFQRYRLKYSFLNQIAGFFDYQYHYDDDGDDDELFLWYG